MNTTEKATASAATFTVTLKSKALDALKRYQQARDVYLASGRKSEDELLAAERAWLHEAHHATEEVLIDIQAEAAMSPTRPAAGEVNEGERRN